MAGLTQHTSEMAMRTLSTTDLQAHNDPPSHGRGNGHNATTASGWVPFVGMAMQLSDDEIDLLPDSAEDKQRLRAAKRGFQLLCKMQSNVEDPPTEPDFKPHADKSAERVLQGYGWTSTGSKAVPNIDDYGLKKAFVDLQITETPEPWTRGIIAHTTETSYYPPTWASYETLFNLQDGVLVALENWSPESIIEREDLPIAPEDIVPLRHWSDVCFLHREQAILERSLGISVKNLEHVFRHNITNCETEEILQMVTRQPTAEAVGEWPGMSFGIEAPQALAALGCPNGAGLAWLLIQHKETLGSRMVDRVHIFDCKRSSGNGRGEWCLYLHITDSPVVP